MQQLFPIGMRLGEPLRVDDAAGPFLGTPLIGVDLVGAGGVGRAGGIGEIEFDVLQQARRIALQRQQVIAALLHDALGDFPHRVDRHDLRLGSPKRASPGRKRIRIGDA